MDKGSKFLSELVLNRTYAATKVDGTKETKEEVIERVITHHCARFPEQEKLIRSRVTEPLLKGQIVPAMRWMQFAGEGIRRSNIRGFNCAYTTIESFQDFAEIFYILMCGTGMGYSVRRKHVNALPIIQNGSVQDSLLVADSKEGWADSVRSLLENPQLEFNYEAIRKKGEPLSTGGTASGPEALMLLHERMRNVLKLAVGRRLTPLECHDLACMIADGVVVGGVRRAALISLFDPEESEMLTCKHGNWWEHAPWRGRANNSAVLHRADPNAKEKFNRIMDACYDSNSGEPGIYWTNDEDWGTNPCVEIALRSKQMCNLTEVNLAACNSFEEVVVAVTAATILGTLQAAYTEFPYIDERWSANCKEEALLGVSLTGQAQAWQHVAHGPATKYLASLVKSTNVAWAKRLGINPSARLTCTKPSGTASAYFGTTSGIHAAHAPYYIRRVRVDVDHPVSRHLLDVLPPKFIEKDVFNSDNWVVSIPIKMEGAIVRGQEPATTLMDRSKHMARNWIAPGHVAGVNSHNISMTVSYREEERESIREWMWTNREYYNGISLLPYSDHSYQQAPFEEISKSDYLKLAKRFPKVDFSGVNYGKRADDRQSEAACAGGSCELT